MFQDKENRSTSRLKGVKYITYRTKREDMKTIKKKNVPIMKFKLKTDF